MTFRTHRWIWAAACSAFHAAPAAAQSSATAELAAPGEYSLAVHANYTPSGSETPAFPGGIVPEGSVNGVFEWVYGVSDWHEAGLSFPVYSITRDGQVLLQGIKLRSLFAVPHAETRDFFYGVNFELSYNAQHWDTSRWGAEILTIVGARAGRWDFILNPIFATSFKGGLAGMEFAPSARIAYNATDIWAFAIEHYADFGPIGHFLPSNQQGHTTFGVVNYAGVPLDVEAGIGFGLTDASENVVLKLILAHTF